MSVKPIHHNNVNFINILYVTFQHFIFKNEVKLEKLGRKPIISFGNFL